MEPLWDVIKDYVKDNKLFISDLNVLCDLPLSITSFKHAHYKIYCKSIIQHGIALTNKLYDVVKDRTLNYTLSMKTIIMHEEIHIDFAGWTIVKLYKLGSSRGNNLDAFGTIQPVIKDDMYYMPPEIEIIDVLQQNASFAANDEIEDKLINLIKDKYTTKLSNIQGNQKEPSKKCIDFKKDTLEELKVLIIADYFSTKNQVALLGSCGYQWALHGKNMCTGGDVIQFTSVQSPQSILGEINKFILSRGLKWKVTLDSTPLDMMIPKDFRTRRVRFDISFAGQFGMKTKRFMDYFNTIQFEIIPCFKKDNVLVANHHILLRGLFMDLWTWNLLSHAKLVNTDLYNQKIKHIFSTILQIYDNKKVNADAEAKKINAEAADEADTEKTSKKVNGNATAAASSSSTPKLEISGFLGIYEDYEITNKKKMLASNMFIPPYMPIHELKKYNKLRDVPKEGHKDGSKYRR